MEKALRNCVGAEGDPGMFTTRFHHRRVALKENEGKGRDLGGGIYST